MDKENIPVVEHENQQLPLPIIQPQENDDLFKVYPSSKVTLKDKKETKIQQQNENVYLSNNNNNNNNNMETQQEEEDFSFDTLRQRALNKIVLCASRSHPSTATNASNGSNDTAVMEDFSFSTLKERAANPNKSNHHHHHHSVVDKKQIKRGGMGLTSTPTKATMVKNNSTTSTTSSIPSEMNHHGCSKRPHLAPITIHPPYIHTPTKNSNNNNNNTPHHKTNINSSTSKPTTPFDPNKYQFRPKIRKEEVQATDHSHASVQKLSQWLSNDPFDTKKQIVIRKGVQIANKARVFERGPTLEELLGKDSSCGGDGQSMSLSTKSTKALTRVQREQEYFRKGGVSEGKEWLKHAFGNGHGEETVSGGNGSGSGTHLEKTEVLCVQDKKRMFEQGMLFQQKKKI